jgi:hypothetical protein
MEKSSKVLGKKFSLEPESNQWPKDLCNITSTVLRSTNWAIEGDTYI